MAPPPRIAETEPAPNGCRVLRFIHDLGFVSLPLCVSAIASGSAQLSSAQIRPLRTPIHDTDSTPFGRRFSSKQPVQLGFFCFDAVSSI
ncbi:hypothetical protein N7539_007332 [Penicillium diatomitis]|uniref:Uncharacterized protein n=1 Tax=Penicillium diatomitis TaxID=2819901 RepID=A0A9X0BNW9_9EURO|nr:uncharacterized protein N7539_007332 [Penicillium diatomitis]KAJ5477188.1 hypothetical protein N7539_007332 [Penicillium diatomitis]